MATSKWTAPTSEATILGISALNGLTDGSNKITTSPVSNDASDELYLYGAFRLYLATQGSARDAGAFCSLYLLPEVGGTYTYGGDSLDPGAEHLVGQFSFDAATTARHAVLTNILLPPTDFHILLMNETGQTLASGSILTMEKYNVQSVS